MLINKRLILAHFWLAFAVFGARAAARRLADVRAQPAATPGISNPECYYRSVTAHGTVMGYVFPTLVAMGFGYAITRSRAEAAAGRPPLGLGRLLAGRRRRRDGDGPGGAGPRLGALHLLSADDRQSLLLHRRRAGRGRLVDLGRADVDQPARSGSATIPGKPVPLAMFANVAGSYLWAWTAVGAALEMLFQIIAGGARPEDHHRRRAGARVLLLDAARHRLFLADADLHRLLHHRAARDRRPALQRHDGADRLHPVPRGLDADRHAPPFADPQVGAGFKFVHSAFTGAGRAADAADGVHDLRLGRDRRPPARRPRRCSAGSARCPGTTRSCWRSRSRSSCSASAAPAGSST